MKATFLPGHSLPIELEERLILECPFCHMKIYDSEDTRTKTFMGRHLAKKHQKEMERVLGKLQKARKIGFKKGL